MANRLADGETDEIDNINDRPTYDASAYTNWGAVSQDIGIAISEDSTVVGGASIGTSDISTSISSPVALMDTAANVDGVNVVDVDLVQVTVADVVALANDDHGGTISLSGVIQDTAGTPNVADADSNAQVVLEDAFPPMVMDARWDGTTIAIQFNEAIELPTNSVATSAYGATSVAMQLLNPADDSIIAITLDGAETDDTAANYFAWDAGTNTLTVNNTAISAGWAGDGGAENEFLYEDDILGDSDEEQHAVLIWDDILDTNGNRWADYHSFEGPTNGTNGVTLDGDTDLGDNVEERWEVNAPQFLAVNELGQFNISWSWSGVIDAGGTATADDDGIATVAVQFSHPLDLTLIDISPADGTIQQGELQALFAIDENGDGTFADLADVGGNLALSLSADERTITVSLAEDADALTGIVVGTTVLAVGDVALTGITVPSESALTVETAESTLTLTATTN
jgi:hypothetical protein